MYIPTKPQQDLWAPERILPPSVVRRLRDNWAELFRHKVFPRLISIEPVFAGLYSTEGRPNWSIARMLGLILIQEMHDDHDQAALDNMSFDLRWQHALMLTPAEAYLSRRSLVAFRSRMVKMDDHTIRARKLFYEIAQAAIDDLGISTDDQRADSTLFSSNITTRGRIDLFHKTIRHFIRGLRKNYPDRIRLVPAEVLAWYERAKSGWFGNYKGAELKRKRLSELANWLGQLVSIFADDETVAVDERYGLLVRLLGEHCVAVPADKPGDKTSNGDDGGDQPGRSVAGDSAETSTEPVKKEEGDSSSGHDESPEDTPGGSTVVPDTGDAQAEAESHGPQYEPRKKLKSPSTSLQSPFDPDAGRCKKGTGFMGHITETCNNSGTEIITDYEIHSAGPNDKGKTDDILKRLIAVGWLPSTLFADGGYTTGDSILLAFALGTLLYVPASRGRLPEDSIKRDQFTFDEDTGDILQCPAGHTPERHDYRLLHGARGRAWYAYFNGKTCRACELLGRCIARAPNSKKPGALHVEVNPALRARDERLAEQEKPEWWDRYAIRSGVEATMSELKRAHGLRRLRVRGGDRVQFAAAMKLTACNVKRWLKEAMKRKQGGQLGPEDACIWLMSLIVFS